MRTTSRRQLLTAAGALAGTAALGACSSGSSGGPGDASSTTLQWWDQFQPLSELEKATFAAFRKKHRGVTVKYTVYDPNKQGQAIQLAYQSKQMPDVLTLAGITYPASRLVSQGWFAPLANGDRIASSLPHDSVVDGLSRFGGKVYSFPLFSPRQYQTLTWYDKELVERAGLDPASDLATWDSFRSSARKLHKGGTFGWIAPIQFPARMAAHVDDLAMAAGGSGAIDPRTGEYAYATDPYVHAVEFLLSMKKDGSMFPASSSVDARTARARWAAGSAALFFDGSWNVGVIKGSFATFLPKVGVASVPTAEPGSPILYGAPPAGVFWIAKTSRFVERASEILALMTTEAYHAKLAESMDQPPLRIDAVAKSKAEPSYKKAIELFGREVFLAPSAVVRTSAVSNVQAAMADVKPDVGDIVQGAFSGQVTDVRKALKAYNDKLSAERDKAIRSVAAKGKKVSPDTWRFPNWQPGKDFTAQMYD